MLQTLSIRDIVLIDRLDIEFEAGLCVLTGETGAGKSILLDCLGLALGARADTSLIRRGASSGSVAATFSMEKSSVVLDLLSDHSIVCIDTLILRRVLAEDGRNRAYANDQPISAGLLRKISDHLAEIQCQHGAQDLLTTSRHRDLLDSYGGLSSRVSSVSSAYSDWRKAHEALAAAKSDLVREKADEDYLEAALAEIDQLAPVRGEEVELVELRVRLRNAEKVSAGFEEVTRILSGADGVTSQVHKAERLLHKIATYLGELSEDATKALERLAAEVVEAESALEGLLRRLDLDTKNLEEVEDRLFSLRALARKHQCSVDELDRVRDALFQRLSSLESAADEIAQLEASDASARDYFEKQARKLSDARESAAKDLAIGVGAELAPLRFNKAKFQVVVERLNEQSWGINGADQVVFEASTNPGQPFVSISQVASGGELARFMLALQVVLACSGQQRTLIFDEVDAGIGGATADAVGERLARLAQQHQVLVVTHSPQVAVRGAHHFRINKFSEEKATFTQVANLEGIARREEIARMLSGAEITDEARAAADRLIGEAATGTRL